MNTEKLHELCVRLRPLAKKYRAALIVLLAGVLLLVSGGREENSDAGERFPYDRSMRRRRVSEP